MSSLNCDLSLTPRCIMLVLCTGSAVFVAVMISVHYDAFVSVLLCFIIEMNIIIASINIHLYIVNSLIMGMMSVFK